MWKAYKAYWKKTFRYRDRATRSEFWWPMLVNVILGIVAISLLIVFGIYVIGEIIGGNLSMSFGKGAVACAFVALPICLFLTISILPAISVSVRRLRDTGLSGWFYLVYAVANAVLPVCGDGGTALAGILEVAMIVIYCMPADTFKRGWWSPDFGNNDKYKSGSGVVMDAKTVSVKSAKRDKMNK